ncbi:protein POF1B isoform X2 [Stigmatopora argus]
MTTNSQKTTTTTYRTLNVASPEPMSTATTSYRTLNIASPEPVLTATTGGSTSPLQYAVNGNYSTLRYLVPVQPTVQQQSYMFVQQPQVVQPMMSPVYLQSVSGIDSDLLFQQNMGEQNEETVIVDEEEIINVIQQKPPPVIEKISRTDVRTDLSEATKMDTRYFAQLLADVYRKNCDIHSCIAEHVSKIRGHRVDLSVDPMEDVESSLPKGATELTKQQIRYLLQTRLTADKSMRLLLSTFSSLREELLRMSEDLRHLENEKESLERDLAFKVDQARQYDSLLEEVRENNRHLQVSLKETTASQRSLESQLMSARNTDSSRDYRMRDLEGQIRTLEKENEMLRQKQLGQSNSSTTLHIKTEELSRQFTEQLGNMRQEKDQEIQRLRTQITRLQTEVTTERTSSASEKSLQLKISELLALLEKRQITITQREEEIRKLMMEKNDSSKTTRTVTTQRYRNQYPILGLLGDDYQTSSSIISEDKTIVIERN